MPTEDGVIASETEQALRVCLSDLGYAAADQDALLARLAADFRSEVPMRLRLWTMLHARLARRGIPLLVLPLTHASETPHVRLGPYFEMTDPTDVVSFAADVHTFYTQPLVK